MKFLKGYIHKRICCIFDGKSKLASNFRRFFTSATMLYWPPIVVQSLLKSLSISDAERECGRRGREEVGQIVRHAQFNIVCRCDLLFCLCACVCPRVSRIVKTPGNKHSPKQRSRSIFALRRAKAFEIITASLKVPPGQFYCPRLHKIIILYSYPEDIIRGRLFCK